MANNNQYLSNSEQYLQVQDAEHYPDSLKFLLNILTINEVPKVVGSAGYLQHKYPGDVDVFESVLVEAPLQAATEYYADQFRTIGQQLSLIEKDVYFLQFKAGIDMRYKYDITAHTSGEQLLAIVAALTNSNLLTEDRKDKLSKAVNDKDLFKELLRQYSVIRWTLPEMINGQKILAANKVITLAEALAMPAVVKIDTVTWFSNRLQSVEVFYFLQYTPQPGVTSSFYDMGEYKNNLLVDIDHYKQPLFFNPLKVMKRLWSISRIIDCQRALEVLTPLFGSDIAALNQIVADVDIITELVSLHQVLPWDKILLEILGLKKRVFNHLEYGLYRGFVEHTDKIYNLWLSWKLSSNVQIPVLISQLKEIKDFLKPIIDIRSEQFLLQFENAPIQCSI